MYQQIMLHTFSSTAYEVADYTLDNLRKYNILQTSMKDCNFLHYRNYSFVGDAQVKQLPQCIFGRLIEVERGTTAIITYLNGNTSNIVIDYAPQYQIYIDKENPMVGIKVTGKAILEYGFTNYYKKKPPAFR